MDRSSKENGRQALIIVLPMALLPKVKPESSATCSSSSTTSIRSSGSVNGSAYSAYEPKIQYNRVPDGRGISYFAEQKGTYQKRISEGVGPGFGDDRYAGKTRPNPRPVKPTKFDW
jgi:hypothetical protein